MPLATQPNCSILKGVTACSNEWGLPDFGRQTLLTVKLDSDVSVVEATTDVKVPDGLTFTRNSSQSVYGDFVIMQNAKDSEYPFRFIRVNAAAASIVSFPTQLLTPDGDVCSFEW